MNIDLDMYQMTAVAVVVYYVGLRLKRRFNIFDQYCIRLRLSAAFCFRC